MYLCYTDGSCKAAEHAPGGWGYFIKTPSGVPLEAYGWAVKTHSKMMEYTAVAEAFKALPAGVEVSVFSDSQTLVETCRVKLAVWRANGWKNVDAEILKIVREIDEQITSKKLVIEWMWIRGHRDNEGNARADELAAKGAREAKAKLKKLRTPERV
jgi:ribonuclease HI